MATEKMTIREFLENVVNAEISDEMTAFALERISKLDEKNAKKRTSPTKKQSENDEIKAEILATMKNGVEYKASEIGAMFGISTQKASALLVQLEKTGIVQATEKREKGKGKVKVYTYTTDAETDYEPENIEITVTDNLETETESDEGE